MIANCVVCGKEFEKRGPAKTCGKECSNLYHKAYKQTPEYRSRKKANEKHYYQTPKGQVYHICYRQTPEFKLKRRTYDQKPERKNYHRAKQRTVRVARCFGIPHILFASLKIIDQFDKSQEHNAP